MLSKDKVSTLSKLKITSGKVSMLKLKSPQHKEDTYGLLNTLGKHQRNHNTNLGSTKSFSNDNKQESSKIKKKLWYLEEIEASMNHRTFLKSEYKLKRNCVYKSKIPLQTKQMMEDIKKTIDGKRTTLNFNLEKKSPLSLRTRLNANPLIYF